jgi:hypothetical protein
VISSGVNTLFINTIKGQKVTRWDIFLEAIFIKASDWSFMSGIPPMRRGTQKGRTWSIAKQQKMVDPAILLLDFV